MLFRQAHSRTRRAVTHRPTLDYNTVVLADGGASAGLALAPHSVVLADGGAPAATIPAL